MKHSYLLIGIRPSKFIAMLKRNNGFSFKYLHRVLFLLTTGLWSGFFSFLENRRFKTKINSIKKLNPPIFIVGNWRTGTTFLHQLLALDPQFNFMSVFMVSHPDHFLVSKKYYMVMMSKLLNGKTRPMDNVKMGVDEPQEDEYAIIKLYDHLILEKLIFQSSNEFFIDEKDDFLPKNEKKFLGVLELLMQKMQLRADKTPLFKNPFHSLRIPYIRKHFPEARYIHIYRNPLKVIPSSIHMWNIVGRQNILKGRWIEPSIENIARLYRKIIIGIRNEFQSMKSNLNVEIQFENLEKNPVDTVKEIYKQLELNFSLDYENKLIDYCDGLKSYKKNTHSISEDDKKQIKNIMHDTTPEYF
ncbi:MAG: hypothetical protein DRI84_01595 [Bacteroidetes bacterium]|nr:MAG: hypothetical protein DRI84_01595 [Bacteroidota bacterium]